MPQIGWRALVLGGIIVCALGCGSRFQRSKYDPFAVPKQATGRHADHHPQLMPPGNTANDVAQVGREFHSKRPWSEQPPRPPTVSNRTLNAAEQSDWDASELDAPPRSISRPTPRGSFDHSPDYSWIQGKLEYTSLSGGIWRVRYAPLSADDQYGGCMILQSPPDPSQFRANDMVYVEGRILDVNTRGLLPNPVYQADLIDRVGG